MDFAHELGRLLANGRELDLLVQAGRKCGFAEFSTFIAGMRIIEHISRVVRCVESDYSDFAGKAPDGLIQTRQCVRIGVMIPGVASNSI